MVYKKQSFSITHPGLLLEWDYRKNQLLGLDPKSLVPGSAKRASWICAKGHSWDTTLVNRTRNGHGCPYCSGRLATAENNLTVTNPEILKVWDYRRNKLGPEKYKQGSNKKVWLVCEKGHSFDVVVYDFTSTKSKCPYCSNKKVGYGNDLLTNFSELCKEWDFDKNTLSPEEVTYGSGKKVWWKCSKNHSWKANIHNRSLKRFGCKYCSNQKAGYGNDLLTNFPDLCQEWDYEKNELEPNQVIPGSQKKHWWVCGIGHSWKCSPYSRAIQGTDCKYCSNKEVGYGNDLLTTHPDIAKEWDYDKNKLGPDKVVYGSNKNVWWKCSKGHSWKTFVFNRAIYKTGCPYCSNKKVGYGNDLLTNFPELCEEWDFDKNQLGPDKYVYGSCKKAWWICKTCSHEWRTVINNSTSPRNLNGCPKCAETNWVSKPSQKWLDSLAVEQREVQIGRFRVDGFDPETNTVYEFLGDYWHGNPKIFSAGKNAHNNKSFDSLHQQTMSRINKIKSKGYKVVYIWESDFNV